MKTFLLGLVSTAVVTSAAMFSGLRTVPETRITWRGSLAVIEWTEPLADPAAGEDEAPFTMLTGPYIGWLTPTEATIGWEVVAERKVTEKPYASFSIRYPMEKMQFRSVVLKGLEPDTEYRYQLKAQGYAGREIAFRTLPDPSATSFRFAMIGDTQRGDVPESAEVERKLFGQILAWKPALVLHLGDMLGTGRGDGLSGRKGWYRTLTRNREMRGSLLLAPTAGNHCLLGKGHAWYADYFGDVKGLKEKGEDGSYPPFYYSFDVGSVHFVSLCTESAKVLGGKYVGDQKARNLPFSYNEQLSWLERDLKRARAPWKVVFFHQPFHTAGGYPAPEYFRKDFGAVCDRHGVQLLLSGHDHSYQKTSRILNATRELSDQGTVQVVSGGGDIKQFDARPNRPAWSLTHRKINHYVQVEVSSEALQLTAVDVNGKVFDVWRLPRQGQPEQLPLPVGPQER